jgi:hypothetical protein
MSQSRSLRTDRTFAQQRGSGLGLIGAVLIHVTVVAATLFSFAHKLDIVDQSAPIVPVDLITIGDKNNIRPTVTKHVKLDQDVVPPSSDLTPTPPPEIEMPDEAPSEPVVKQPDAMLMPEVKPKPATKPNEEKSNKLNMKNLLDDLLKAPPSKATSPNAKLASRTQKGIGAQDAATAALETALASQIYACYSPPIGAPRAEDLIVDFDLYLNRDGSVARPPQLTGDSQAAAARNPYTRAGAEAARRAIYTCAPYRLPANRFSDWQENEVHFDPHALMGLQ